MPELSVTVRVPWPKHPTLAALEKAIFKVLMAAGRELLKQAFRALEEEILAEGPGARQRRRRRYLGTRFGEIRFFRWQVRQQGRYGYPLEEALGIPSRDPCSPWVKATAAFLAQAHPFRQAARTGAAPSATSKRTPWTPSSSTRSARPCSARRSSSPGRLPSPPGSDDELLAAQLARLARRMEAAEAERRRLADLYQAGLIDLVELRRRAKEVDARRRHLAERRASLEGEREELARGNRLRRRVQDFSRLVLRALDGLDDFDRRQQLLRLLVEEVRVQGWQVEVRLRIPLDEPPPDGPGPSNGEEPPGAPRCQAKSVCVPLVEIKRPSYRLKDRMIERVEGGGADKRAS